MTLSKTQQEIVDSDARNIIVDAGAGSGKTRTLTERVKRILNSGVNPKSVVVITFTNLAADELKSRLSCVKGINSCFVGTIHSYANKLLKQTAMQYEIFESSHEVEFMKLLIEKYAKLCTMSDYMTYSKYRYMADKGLISKDSIEKHIRSYAVLEEILYLLGVNQSYKYPETVKTLCKKNHIIDFDELIVLSTKFFNENKTKLSYLFVDEFQDISYPVYKFLMTLNAENNFVVGDDYQSIYGFSSGDVSIFLSLMNNENWKSFMLTENYRTPKRIMDYANRIIKKASDIIVKDTVCMNEDPGDLKISSKFLFEDFIHSIDPTEDWFILVRSNKELNEVDRLLKNYGKDHTCIRSAQLTSENKDDILDKVGIKVMTVHTAKGNECRNVAIYGNFPVSNKNPKSEEIKIYYVGVTRAMHSCKIFS